ncbi:MAG: hypothetical protein A4E70_00245 [Syntrophus sp. PtaU1.Bin005]|uniref:WG repeat-containing protein n=1 Tax=Syntrophus buswellii TaxID=43774 RepID=UPI0009C7689C|nr:MAG: hypothetical protein A4E70_00245 [Syntrophus sp. PtaU1.Bin005]
MLLFFLLDVIDLTDAAGCRSFSWALFQRGIMTRIFSSPGGLPSERPPSSNRVRQPLRAVIAGNFEPMKKILFVILFFLSGCSMPVQENRSWTPFWNEDSTLMGFKDSEDRIRIAPRYAHFSTARTFEKILAVMEQKNGGFETSYLTKSGKVVGRGNVYMIDNGPDCESEGFIRFRDRTTGKAGLYDSQGNVAIPAEYDDLTNVRNGLVAALKGAEKKYWDGDDIRGCGHYSWAGGKEILVNTHDHILIDPFNLDPHLDFFSLRITDHPLEDPNQRTFLGVDGRYYSFLDYKKEFSSWLNDLIRNGLSRKALLDCSYGTIYFWKEPDGWTSERSPQFVERNFELIRGRLSDILREKADYFISMDGLNPFIFEGSEFAGYFNNCGEPKPWRYPVMSVVINRNREGHFRQDHFDFLRTEKGYKLISVSLGNEQ